MANRLTPVQILERLVAFPTVSRDTNLPLIDWVQGYLADHGIPAHRHLNEDGTKAALFAHVGPQVPGAVVLSGHTDVVPVDGQTWHSDPFTLTEQDGRLYGRGACDMKGFDALAIWALVEAAARPLSRPLQLALSYDEEIGCTGAAPLIAAMAETLPPAQDVIVGEPTMMKAVTGHKGSVSFWVHVHGYEIHSSLLDRGVNAIMFGAKLIDWANTLNAAQLAAPPAPMAALFDPPCTLAHVGQISGGTAHNITAKDCGFGFGFRVVPGETLDQWRAALHARAAEIEAQMQAIRPETRIEIRESFALPPFAPTKANSAEELVRALTGDNGQTMVSFGTEASHFQAAGMHSVVCGPGDIAQAHQPDEFITIAQMQAGQAFLRGLLDRLT